MLKILSWNIRQGGGSRVAEICKYLISTKAQIITLNEFKNNAAGNHIRRNLLRSGYIHQGVSADSNDNNSVCIVSKLPFNNTLFYDIDDKYSHCMIKAEFQSIDVYGVYMPHKKKHKLFDYLNAIDYIKPSIICGDFNSGINTIDQKGNSFWYEDDLKKLLKFEFIDAFRLHHPDAKEYSWYSHQGNGYRYDHTYASKSLKSLVKDCYYDHSIREQNISDHSPMILQLG